MYLWNIGLINVPNDIDKIFSTDGKFLVSPTLEEDFYFEMSGESMYYALKDLEKNRGIDLSAYKKRISNAVLNRIELCEGKLFHNSLSGKSYDTQLRSSSSAIRILLEAIKDGFDDYYTLSNIINYHYSFYFKWSQGIWFCHDTSEYYGKGPKTHLNIKVFNKDYKNTLTLNTHFDSLSTLLLIEPYIDYLNLSFSIKDYIESALISIQYLIDYNKHHTLINKWLQQLDSKLLNKYIYNDSKSAKLYERIIHPLLFKVVSPTIFFDYGFISRDLAVLNRHIDYHIVNMIDIARVLCLLKKRKDYAGCKNLYDAYFNILMKGLQIGSTIHKYNEYVYRDDLSIAWLCELYALASKLQVDFPYNVEGYSYPKYNPFIV